MVKGNLALTIEKMFKKNVWNSTYEFVGPISENQNTIIPKKSPTWILFKKGVEKSLLMFCIFVHLIRKLTRLEITHGLP